MEVVNGPPTVAEIDLGALGANYRAIKSAGRGAELMAVVKADAYGHGAVEVTRALRDEGCRHFGVARVREARELRAAGVRDRDLSAGRISSPARRRRSSVSTSLHSCTTSR